jgi:hypothetical protein
LSSQSDDAKQNEISAQQAMTASSLLRKQRISQAWQLLQQNLIDFLSGMKQGGESELERTPTAGDLIPYFEPFAWSILNAWHKKAILAAPSFPEAKARINAAIDSVVTEICQKPIRKSGRTTRAGVWFRAVEIAADAVDLGTRTTQFGEYGRATFMHPKRTQLKVLLQVKAQTLLQEFLSLQARESEATQNDRGEGPTEARAAFPIRAQWLKACLSERNWNMASFHAKGGPDRKTTRKILRGDAVSESTLERVAQALSKSHRNPPLPPISRSDIPNE